MGLMGNGDGHGRWCTALGTTAIEDLSNGTDVNGIVLEDLDERLFELGGASLSQQMQQARGRGAEIAALVGDDPQKRLAGRGRLAEKIEAAMLPGSGLFRGEPLQ